jgi:hypothetical protein
MICLHTAALAAAFPENCLGKVHEEIYLQTILKAQEMILHAYCWGPNANVHAEQMILLSA